MSTPRLEIQRFTPSHNSRSGRNPSCIPHKNEIDGVKPASGLRLAHELLPQASATSAPPKAGVFAIDSHKKMRHSYEGEKIEGSRKEAQDRQRPERRQYATAVEPPAASPSSHPNRLTRRAGSGRRNPPPPGVLFLLSPHSSRWNSLRAFELACKIVNRARRLQASPNPNTNAGGCSRQAGLSSPQTERCRSASAAPTRRTPTRTACAAAPPCAMPPWPCRPDR